MSVAAREKKHQQIMIPQNIQAVSLLLCLTLRTYASPFRPWFQVKASRPLGYDPDFRQTDDDIIPSVRVLGDSDLVFNSTLNQTAPLAEPFILDEPISDDNDDDDNNNNGLRKRFINGNDNRYLFEKDSYPFNTVGKLQWSNGVFCSGALVGPRHVLTAKHCIVSGATATFSPGFDSSARHGSGRVQNIITSNQEWGTPCGWKGDWAVMILDQRLGDKLGFFGVKLPDPKKVDVPMFRHMGYPGDKDSGLKPYRVNGNPIESYRSNFDCDATGPYYTDTDCAGGQSGGPHWMLASNKKRYIWGTLSVTFDGGNGVAWAGWGSGNEMVNAVIKARKQYP